MKSPLKTRALRKGMIPAASGRGTRVGVRMKAGDDRDGEDRARRYRERAAHLRDTASEEVRPYRRAQRRAYADQLETLAARYEAERVPMPEPVRGCDGSSGRR